MRLRAPLHGPNRYSDAPPRIDDVRVQPAIGEGFANCVERVTTGRDGGARHIPISEVGAGKDNPTVLVYGGIESIPTVKVHRIENLVAVEPWESNEVDDVAGVVAHGSGSRGDHFAVDRILSQHNTHIVNGAGPARPPEDEPEVA